MSRINWALFSSSRVAGYENSFLGLQSKLSVMAKKKLRDQPEAVDVLSLGKIQLYQGPISEILYFTRIISWNVRSLQHSPIQRSF